jgi:hypothetical protein
VWQAWSRDSAAAARAKEREEAIAAAKAKEMEEARRAWFATPEGQEEERRLIAFHTEREAKAWAAHYAAEAKAEADAKAKAEADAKAKEQVAPVAAPAAAPAQSAEEDEWNALKKKSAGDQTLQGSATVGYGNQATPEERELALEDQRRELLYQEQLEYDKERLRQEKMAEDVKSHQNILSGHAKFEAEEKQRQDNMYKSYETPGQSQTNLGVQQQQQNSNAALAAGYEAQWGAPGAQGAGHAQEVAPPAQESAPAAQEVAPAQVAAPAQWTPAMGTAQLDAMAAEAAKFTPPTYTPPTYTPPTFRSWFGFGGAPPLFLGTPVNAASSCTIPSGGARRRTKRKGGKRRATRR